MNKNMVKYTILCVFVIFLSSGFVNADTSLKIDTESAAPGDIITLPLTIQTETSISALSTDISYDAERLLFEYAKVGEAALDKNLISNQITANKIRLGLISLGNESIDDGVVIEVTFSVDPTAKSGIAIIRQDASGSTPDGVKVLVEGEPCSIIVE